MNKRLRSSEVTLVLMTGVPRRRVNLVLQFAQRKCGKAPFGDAPKCVWSLPQSGRRGARRLHGFNASNSRVKRA
ncbi:hypothetical protein NDN95_23650, partial [Burkholderia glumae]|nr:hypothetical protein [Burkholderia glumae]